MTMESTTTLERPNAPAVASSALLAWEVEIHDMRCICFAPTKAKAQWIATKSYWEAYGRTGQWPRARAWRAERHDKSRLALKTRQQAWSEDYVLNTQSR
jgi:hypothetical protein